MHKKILSFCMLNCLGKCQHILVDSINSQHWGDEGSWNHFICKTRTWLSHMAFWRPGHPRSQGISSHIIKIIIPDSAHCSSLMPYGIAELTHRFNQWLVLCLAPSHYLNHGWHIVNLTLGNNIHWNLNQNANNFIEENAFEYAICKMLATLRPKYINIAHANNSAHYLYVLVFPVWFP